MILRLVLSFCILYFVTFDLATNQTNAEDVPCRNEIDAPATTNGKLSNVRHSRSNGPYDGKPGDEPKDDRTNDDETQDDEAQADETQADGIYDDKAHQEAHVYDESVNVSEEVKEDDDENLRSGNHDTTEDVNESGGPVKSPEILVDKIALRDFPSDKAECFSPLSVKRIISATLEHVKQNPHDLDHLINEVRSDFEQESQLFWFKNNLKSDMTRSLLMQHRIDESNNYEEINADPQCTIPFGNLAQAAHKAFLELEQHPLCLQLLFGRFKKQTGSYVPTPDLSIMSHILEQMKPHVETASSPIQTQQSNGIPLSAVEAPHIITPPVIIQQSDFIKEVKPVQEVIIQPHEHANVTPEVIPLDEYLETVHMPEQKYSVQTLPEILVDKEYIQPEMTYQYDSMVQPVEFELPEMYEYQPNNMYEDAKPETEYFEHYEPGLIKHESIFTIDNQRPSYFEPDSTYIGDIQMPAYIKPGNEYFMEHHEPTFTADSQKPLIEPVNKISVDSQKLTNFEPDSEFVIEPQKPGYFETKAKLIVEPERPDYIDPNTHFAVKHQKPTYIKPETEFLVQHQRPAHLERETEVAVEQQRPAHIDHNTHFAVEHQKPTYTEPYSEFIVEHLRPTHIERETDGAAEHQKPTYIEPYTHFAVEHQRPTDNEPYSEIIVEHLRPPNIEPDTKLLVEHQKPTYMKPDSESIVAPQRPEHIGPYSEFIVEHQRPSHIMKPYSEYMIKSQKPSFIEPETGFIVDHQSPSYIEKDSELIFKHERPLYIEPESGFIVEHQRPAYIKPETEVMVEHQKPTYIKSNTNFVVDHQRPAYIKPDSQLIVQQEPTYIKPDSGFIVEHQTPTHIGYQSFFLPKPQRPEYIEPNFEDENRPSYTETDSEPTTVHQRPAYIEPDNDFVVKHQKPTYTEPYSEFIVNHKKPAHIKPEKQLIVENQLLAHVELENDHVYNPQRPTYIDTDHEFVLEPQRVTTYIEPSTKFVVEHLKPIYIEPEIKIEAEDQKPTNIETESMPVVEPQRPKYTGSETKFLVEPHTEYMIESQKPSYIEPDTELIVESLRPAYIETESMYMVKPQKPDPDTEYMIESEIEPDTPYEYTESQAPSYIEPDTEDIIESQRPSYIGSESMFMIKPGYEYIQPETQFEIESHRPSFIKPATKFVVAPEGPAYIESKTKIQILPQSPVDIKPDTKFIVEHQKPYNDPNMEYMVIDQDGQNMYDKDPEFVKSFEPWMVGPSKLIISESPLPMYVDQSHVYVKQTPYISPEFLYEHEPPEEYDTLTLANSKLTKLVLQQVNDNQSSDNVENIYMILKENQAAVQPKLYNTLLAILTAHKEGVIENRRFSKLLNVLLKPDPDKIWNEKTKQVLWRLLRPNNQGMPDITHLDTVLTLIQTPEQDSYSITIINQLLPYLIKINGSVDHRTLHIMLSLLNRNEKAMLKPVQMKTLLSLLKPNKNDRIYQKHVDIALSLIHWDEIPYLTRHNVNTLFLLLRPSTDNDINEKAVEITYEILSPNITKYLTKTDINILLKFLRLDKFSFIESKRLDIVLLALKNMPVVPNTIQVFVRLLKHSNIIHSKYIDILLTLQRERLLNFQLLDALVTLLKQEKAGHINQTAVNNVYYLLEPYKETHSEIVIDISNALRLTTRPSMDEINTKIVPDNLQGLLSHLMNSVVHTIGKERASEFETLQPHQLWQEYGHVNHQVPDSTTFFNILEALHLEQDESHSSEKLPHNFGYIELTYRLKDKEPILYQPVYYFKYKIPVISFLNNVKSIIAQHPQLIADPVKLLQQMILDGKVPKTLPNLEGFDRDNMLKLTFNDGDLIQAKLMDEKGSNFNEQPKIANQFNSDVLPEEILAHNKVYAAKYYTSAGKSMNNLEPNAVNMGALGNVDGSVDFVDLTDMDVPGVESTIGGYTYTSDGAKLSLIDNAAFKNIDGLGSVDGIPNFDSLSYSLPDTSHQGNMGGFESMSNTQNNYLSLADLINQGNTASYSNSNFLNIKNFKDMDGFENVDFDYVRNTNNVDKSANTGDGADIRKTDDLVNNYGLRNMSSLANRNDQAFMRTLANNHDDTVIDDKANEDSMVKIANLAKNETSIENSTAEYGDSSVQVINIEQFDHLPEFFKKRKNVEPAVTVPLDDEEQNVQNTSEDVATDASTERPSEDKSGN